MAGAISNGQVVSRDIRQDAVKTLHVVDDAITSPKIEDLAVTFPDKIDAPIFVEVQQHKPGSGLTVTTTRQIAATVTVAVPAWVDQVSVFVVAEFQLTNTSGGDVLMTVFFGVDGGATGAGSHEAVNNQTQHVSIGGIASVTGVAGSSFDVDLSVQISTGTNTANNQDLYVLVVGTR